MKSYLVASALSVFLVAEFVSPARADVVHCADVRAADVRARVENGGDASRCGVGLVLFGFEISIGGPKCYAKRFTYPAHQTCNGDANEGTWCAPAGSMNVAEESCHCARLAIGGTGLTLPECVCNSSGTSGTIEDFETKPCDDPHGPGIPIPAAYLPGGLGS